MTTTEQSTRRGKRGNRVGLVVTLALHGGAFAAIGIAHSQSAPLGKQRHFIQAEIVRFGTPPDQTHLPRITQPPQPAVRPKVLQVVDKLSKESENAPRPVQRIETPELDQVQLGAANGTIGGTSQQAVGDPYLAEIANVLRQNYFLPAGMAPDQIPTPPEIRFRFSDDGTIADVTLTKSSGSPLVDDACLNAARMTRKIPTPPASFSARGLGVACAK